MGTSPAERGQTGPQYGWKFDHYGACGGKHTLTPNKERRLNEDDLCVYCHAKAVKNNENNQGDGI